MPTVAVTLIGKPTFSPPPDVEASPEIGEAPEDGQPATTASKNPRQAKRHQQIPVITKELLFIME
jgi:hypothetical protein